MRKIKVAVNSGPLRSGHAVRGIGVHTRELINALGEIKTKKVKVKAVGFQKEDLSKYDISHYSSFHPFFFSIPFSKPSKKVILTIHDLIPLIYPENYPPGIKGKIRYHLQKLLVRKNVDAILTISETSKKDICRILGVDPKIVYVTHLAQRDVFRPVKDKKRLKEVQNKYDLPSRFVLYVGDVNYNKNIPNLIKAAKLAKLPLVICGKQALDIEELGTGLDVLSGPQDWIRFLFDIPHPELSHYQDILKEFNKSENIKRLGFVPDEDLLSIYSLATVYCQPSLYEGFGLPILEAMACGTPVVASRIQTHVEIAEGGCLFADPKDAKDMAEKLEKVARSTKVQSELRKKGNKIAKNYSWKKTAKETVKIYDRVFAR